MERRSGQFRRIDGDGCVTDATRLCGTMDHDTPLLTPAQADWLRCKPWIEAALSYAHGTHTIQDVEDAIGSGHMQFWPGENCALVTELIDYPRKRALNFFLIGGDLQELVEKWEPHICEWARKAGCTHVIGVGRRGFERVFRSRGYSPVWFVIMKDLKND